MFRYDLNNDKDTVLYDFTNSNSGAAAPAGNLIQANDSYLYGLTEGGGTYSFGTIFKSSTSGNLSILYNFNDTDGKYPEGSLIQANDGNLYGMTMLGGKRRMGTLFKCTTSGTFTKLVDFDTSVNGGFPWGNLIQASDGNLYGMTSAFNQGTIFKCTTSGILTTLIKFNGSKMPIQNGSLIQVNEGNLYGMCKRILSFLREFLHKHPHFKDTIAKLAAFKYFIYKRFSLAHFLIFIYIVFNNIINKKYMYRGFQIVNSNFDKDHFKLSFEAGNDLFNRHKTQIETNLNNFILNNGSLNGTKMQNNWFPQINCDVFISHSGENKDEAITLAGFLYRNFGIKAFVDSCIWGYSNRLLWEIDKEYCTNGQPNSFDYNKRNYSTSHVHMMLSTALTMMIDRCECLFFLKTPSLHLYELQKQDFS